MISRVSLGKSAMHGARMAPRASTAIRAQRKQMKVAAGGASSGFLLDMSDLIASGSSVGDLS